MSGDRLTDGECVRLGTLLSIIDHQRIRLHRSSATGYHRAIRNLVLWLSRNRAVALGNHIFLPDHCERDVAVLAHELTHCGQYQAWGPLRYFGRGAGTQLRDLFYRTLRIGSSPYRYRSEPGKPFRAYGMEQQCQIVEDCFRGDPVAQAMSPFQPGPAANVGPG
jgi:hypothetical protein